MTGWSTLPVVFPMPRARRYLEADSFDGLPTLTAQLDFSGQASVRKTYRFRPKHVSHFSVQYRIAIPQSTHTQRVERVEDRAPSDVIDHTYSKSIQCQTFGTSSWRYGNWSLHCGAFGIVNCIRSSNGQTSRTFQKHHIQAINQGASGAH